MKTSFPTFTRRVLLAAALAAAAPLASAQAYPNKPIRLLVGYNPGGGVDAMARMLAQRLPALLGQTVLVENRSGASGMIAAEFVAKAPPDGYTLLMGETGMLITSLLQPRNFDPVKSFAPVAGAFLAPLMIVSTNNFPANNPRELIALLKAHPGQYAYASSGVGTVQHLGFELFKAQTNTFVVHIPYRGAAQIVPDVISGQVPLGVVSAAAGLAQAKGGKMKVLAMMSSSKLPGTENLPSLADALPHFDVAPRIMVLAPAGTPAPIVEKLNEAVRTVLASPDLAQNAAQLGAVPAYLPPAQVAQELMKESDDWAKIIKAQKISAE